MACPLLLDNSHLHQVSFARLGCWGGLMVRGRRVEPMFVYRYDDGSGDHLLPADEGAWSLEGMGHAATLVTHFLVEGKVRHRAPYSDKFQVFIAPPTSGSWEAQFLLSLASPEAWAGAIAGAAIGLPTLAFKLLRRVGGRATGVPVPDDETAAIEQAHSGNFEALVEAAEPGLVRAHRVVSRETEITFSAGGFSFGFNQSTKEYILTNELDIYASSSIGNVASLNVNRRTGRIFLNELGRSVPFLVHKDAGPQTAVALARSLESYASIRLANSDIVVEYRATRAADGTIKKILIHSATFIFGIR